MNLSKCALGVPSDKFFGFEAYCKGIDLHPAKTKAIQDMKPPKTVKQLKGFMGRVSCVRRFFQP